ncbi:precorrin-2 dehydrogenase/sirohydrochlorin ferrochelatase family protein [Desulfobacterota bacterium M19]
MNYYPVCLNIAGRSCLIIGGGRVAERKAGGLLDCGAEVCVISPRLSPGLRLLYEQGVISWRQRGYESDDVRGAFLVMAATDDHEVQDMVVADCGRHNIPLNVADVPDKCNFILPALVRRGSLSIAVSTSGKSPALARELKKRLRAEIGVEFERLNDMMGLLRTEVMGRGLDQEQNEALFKEILAVGPAAWIKEHNWPPIQAHLEKVLGTLPDSLIDELRGLVETGVSEVQ